MKIYLADLVHTYSVQDKSLLIPLNIGYIKAFAVAKYGSTVDIHLFKHPENLLAKIYKDPPSILGLANYGWNEQLNHKVGKNIRQKFPETLIVMGGPNIDFTPNRRLDFLKKHDYLDLLIVDGGEQPFSDLIHWWQHFPGEYNKLPNNILWREGNQIRSTDLLPIKKMIEDIPSPYLTGCLDEFLELGFIPLIETNRGCPFLCSFCAWGAASKNKVAQFDLEMVRQEINYIGKRAKRVKNWIICDANFGMLKRDIEIAQAIRKVKDQTGFPHKCHLWLAKNVTERNVQIADILREMIVPVMAVQSMDEQVLKKIKRGNISLETYIEYNNKFKKLGSKTFSDLIVPLPGETLTTHKEALRKLCEHNVDVIFNHNIRLLSGTEVNTEETIKTYQFRSRYRLIHGDAGIYQCPDGTKIRAFEYEKSVRETSTFSEDELFYLRKLHFLFEISWNLKVYKPLLDLARFYGINPIDILDKIILFADTASHELGEHQEQITKFFQDLDEFSHAEWFDSEEEIESYFTKPENFEHLIHQEFDKLNVLYTVILLKDYKQAFDRAFQLALSSFGIIPELILNSLSNYTFAYFPSLETKSSKWNSPLKNKDDQTQKVLEHFPFLKTNSIKFFEDQRRQTMVEYVENRKEKTLSKVLNLMGVGALALSNLKLTVKE